MEEASGDERTGVCGGAVGRSEFEPGVAGAAAGREGGPATGPHVVGDAHDGGGGGVEGEEGEDPSPGNQALGERGCYDAFGAVEKRERV
ncbi:MAG: hypothetical protein Q9200_003449 [Gallowayella weberi]